MEDQLGLGPAHEVRASRKEDRPSVRTAMLNGGQKLLSLLVITQIGFVRARNRWSIQLAPMNAVRTGDWLADGTLCKAFETACRIRVIWVVHDIHYRIFRPFKRRVKGDEVVLQGAFEFLLS